MMIPKVKIGSRYRRERFTMRSPTQYESLRPDMTSDDMQLQRALLGERRAVRRWALAYLAALCAGLWWTWFV